MSREVAESTPQTLGSFLGRGGGFIYSLMRTKTFDPPFVDAVRRTQIVGCSFSSKVDFSWWALTRAGRSRELPVSYLQAGQDVSLPPTPKRIAGTLAPLQGEQTSRTKSFRRDLLVLVVMVYTVGRASSSEKGKARFAAAVVANKFGCCCGCCFRSSLCASQGWTHWQPVQAFELNAE